MSNLMLEFSDTKLVTTKTKLKDFSKKLSDTYDNKI